MSPERSTVVFGSTMIDFTVRRSARRATVSIAVEAAGEVVVTAPADTTLTRLEGIVRKKALWIVERRRRLDELTPLPMAREFVSGESFRYLGRQYRLRVERVVAAPNVDDETPAPVRLLGGYLHVVATGSLKMRDQATQVRTALVAWYQAKAADYLPDKLAVWAHRVRVTVPRLIVSDPPKRWGSASKAGVIRINWRAIQAPATLVEYILAHELVHLRHDDHSKAFWSALGRVMPDYDSRKDKLRALGPSVTW